MVEVFTNINIPSKRILIFFQVELKTVINRNQDLKVWFYINMKKNKIKLFYYFYVRGSDFMPIQIFPVYFWILSIDSLKERRTPQDVILLQNFLWKRWLTYFTTVTIFKKLQKILPIIWQTLSISILKIKTFQSFKIKFVFLN